MIFDVWISFLEDYPVLQNILYIVIILAVIGFALISMKIRNPKIILLIVCIVIIYLYSQHVISPLIFAITIIILSITLYISFGREHNENSG